MAGVDRQRFGGLLVVALWVTGPEVVRAAPAGIPPAPRARVEVVEDVHFGETLRDPYRWMENDKDPEWRPFLRGQDAHARAVLAGVPGRARLLERIRQVSGDVTLTPAVQRAGGRHFLEQRPSGAQGFKLLVREGGRTRALVDPTGLKAPGVGHFSLDWWRASPDGALVVYGLSRDGSEDSVLHVMEVASGRILPERIPDTQNASPAWLDDGSGFFYNQLTGAPGTPERYLDSRVRFHRLGTDPTADPIVMARGADPAVAYDRIQAPAIATFPGERHAVLLLSDVRREVRVAVAPLADVLAGKAAWTAVAGFEDEVTDVDLHGGMLHLLANKGAPRGRVLRADLSSPAVATARELVPEGPAVIQSLARARDGLYLRVLDGGVSRLRRVAADGAVTEIPLPFEGTVWALFTEPSEAGALMSYGGWLRPAGIWSVGGDGKVGDTGITPRPQLDVGGYQAVRRLATARDGVKVPYTLLSRAGLPRDRPRPTYLQAYGSYGAALTPSFVGRALALLDAGVVIGFVNVRGGGEFGREWHRAGQLMNKANTWRDLIDVCDALVREGATAPDRLAIGGGSAGGITVGRAMTERPELFAAVVSAVGWSNPLRYVAEPNGYGEEPEWGAISAREGFEALKLIDSYQAVRDGTPYPAVLLTTGATDPRVAPFHPAKMAARLQAATASAAPVLLRVEFDAGHGIGSTRAQQDEVAADTYAFLLWRLGLPRHQPARRPQ